MLRSRSSNVPTTTFGYTFVVRLVHFATIIWFGFDNNAERAFRCALLRSDATTLSAGYDAVLSALFGVGSLQFS
ncbi:hypothetical protein M5D96_013635, partial [Drosophila gunungcola]